MKLFNFRTLVAYEGAHRRCCLNMGFGNMVDVAAIISSAYPGLIFGGRNSSGLLLVNFGF